MMIRSEQLRALARSVAKGIAFAGAAYAAFILALAFIHARPPANTPLPIEGSTNIGKWPDHLNLLTWNIGYAGTGDEADFFMDGGHDVLAKDRATVLKHIHNIVAALHQESEELYLLQEVDSASRRSYYIDQLQLIASALQNYDRSFALNYDVWFVPYPFTRPTGRVRSGLLSLGAYRPREATRVQLPGSVPWPISSFVLDRCLLVWRLPREGGQEWVVANVHLAAYDADGSLRRQELRYLRDFAAREFQAGNSVIIGGDWNSVLPGVRRDHFPSREQPSKYVKDLPQDAFPNGWHWGVPTAHPTNRQISAPYEPGQTYVTVIDGFLVSPNVQISSVNVIPLNFRDSDHEPVTISVVSP